MTEIPYKDFQNLDIRVGKILSVEEIPNSKNLIKIHVDFGNEKRIAVAGLKNYYSAEDLTGKKFIFILNLERKKFLGIESECMVLAADDGKGNVVLLQPEKDIEVGSKIK